MRSKKPTENQTGQLKFWETLRTLSHIIWPILDLQHRRSQEFLYCFGRFASQHEYHILSVKLQPMHITHMYHMSHYICAQLLILLSRVIMAHFMFRSGSPKKRKNSCDGHRLRYI